MPVVSHTPDADTLRDIMVPMRDGVRLATDVFFPQNAGRGPWPAILERTPYDKHEARVNEYTQRHPQVFGREELARFFTDAGFVVVFQDCRGRYGSEGRFTKYRGEAEDGFDTIGWIARQDWCDGQVATMGMSYSAHTQMAAACLNPPALAAMICDCGGFSNAYQGGIRFGGALELKQVTWAFRHALRSRAAAADPVAKAALEATDLRDWMHRLPWTQGHSPLSPVPDYEQFLFEQWTHNMFDDYWKIPALYAAGWHKTMRRIPSVHISGWYDPYAVTAVENFTGLRDAGHETSLILGPWTHGDRSRSYAGDVDFGADCTFDTGMGQDFVQFRIDTFRRHLLGAELPPGPRVRYFVMGGGDGRRNGAGRMYHGGTWHVANTWPPEDSVPTRLFLDAMGHLTGAPPQAVGARSFLFDPERPVPTTGGPITSGAPLMVGGAFDQTERPDLFNATAPGMPLASRADVLIFETAPLDRAVTIAGDVSVSLFVSSDRPTTDFTAKLVDVYPATSDYPHGYAMNLSDGILRTCYRDGFDKQRPLESGEIVEVLVRLYPTANRFEPGHRIRLEISSSNFPRFDVNPNDTVGNDLSGTKFRALNAVHCGPGHLSCLLVNLLPSR
ncbi:CocE/NonD family hydrolase [Roseinatronobacter alkalisoli]|uniref:CocE/NonD family hydrolase n=1 Tax=Roseinatronobacter alkalisoli TaxID=3028235 RepID=A0ABT5T9R8_9RHOB|nr:CocE/NonD family hydrolase [Roseinatronobacter sp. HJB301]MDD7970922.1 CocE/NonD family hydrolase [Roseinatronobacter sp. HJB301]